MTADPTDAHESSSREVILAAAERLMTTVGYDKTSISRISRESGLPVGSVYHHFSGKAALLARVFERVQPRFFGSLAAPERSGGVATTGFREFWDSAVQAIVANFSYFTLEGELLTQSQDDAELRQIMRSEMSTTVGLVAAALLPFVRPTGVPDPPALADRLANAVVTYTRGAVLGAAHDPAALREAMADFFPVLSDLLAAAAPDRAVTSPADGPGSRSC